MQKSTFRWIETSRRDRWGDVVPSHAPVHILEPVAVPMAGQLGGFGQVGSAATVLGNAADKALDAFATILGQVVNRVAAVARGG